jgi:hypothetical protein
MTPPLLEMAEKALPVIKNKKGGIMVKENFPSATKFNLIVGLIFSLAVLALEFACVFVILRDRTPEAFVSAFFVQFMILMCYIIAACELRSYKRRKNFDLYAVKIMKETDIEYLRDNFAICDICQDGILYVEKENYSAYLDFNLSRKNVNYYSFMDWYRKKKIIK